MRCLANALTWRYSELSDRASRVHPLPTLAALPSDWSLARAPPISSPACSDAVHIHPYLAVYLDPYADNSSGTWLIDSATTGQSAFSE